MFYWSPSTGGFYHPDVHGPKLAPVALKRGLFRKPLTTARQVAPGSIPPDVIEVSDEEHAALLKGRGEGRMIVLVDGRAALAEPEPAAAETQPRYAPPGELFAMLYRDLKAAGIDGEFVKHVEAARAAMTRDE
jgi:hypothetical protein